MPESVLARYRRVVRLLGMNPSSRDCFSETQIRKAERRLDVRFPTALRAYYAFVGKHKVNRIHNRLLAPDQMFVSAKHLVFMEENQNVVYWGVRARSAAADPAVFQAMDPDEGPWRKESARLSEFLCVMLCWQGVGDPFGCAGFSERLSAGEVRRVAKRWTPIGRINELTAYVADELPVCVMLEGKYATVQVGGRSEQEMTAFADRYGVNLQSV